MVVAAVVAVVVGMVLGVALARAVLRARMDRRVADRVEAWQAEHAAGEADLAARRSQAVLRGQVAEQLAPLFDDYPYYLGDARFIGKPIDFVVFDGYAEVQAGLRSQLREIVFMDVKTGRAGLSTVERRIKQAVEAGRVRCHHLAAGTPLPP